MCEGFYFRCAARDIFVITTRKNKTKKFAEKVLSKLCLPVTPENVKGVLCRLRKAECELKRTSKGIEYYDIYGENFGGCGYPVSENRTIIIEV